MDYYGEAEQLTVPVELDGHAVTSIGDEALNYCTSLTRVTLLDSVTRIGANPFTCCWELTDIIVSPEHPTLATIDGVLFYKPEKRLVCYPCAYTTSSYAVPQGIRRIGDGAFTGCMTLTSVTLPDSVTRIGNDAFVACMFLTSITLPDTLTSIGNDAFNHCTSLTSVSLPDSLTSIGDGAFNYCTSLTGVTVPDSVTIIGANPFVRCGKLSDIVVSPEHPTLATVDGVLFDKTEKRLVCYPCVYTAGSYAVPQGIRIIGGSAFSWCKSLTSITLPDSVTSIGDAAFMGCSSLTSITLPDSVTSVGDGAFYFCESMTSVMLPDSLTSMGECVFFYCKSLTDVTLPASLTTIGEYAFDGCPNLTLTIPRDTWLTQWCKDNSQRYTYPDALDWLND